MGFAANIADVKNRIARAQKHADTPSYMPDIIAVSKRQPEARIQDALDAGHRLFGENRVEEAEDRWQDRRAAYPDLRLHLIGGLQSRKCAAAVRLFDVIESVDRPSLADKLARAMDSEGKSLPVYIQVNTGRETQKGGVLPEDLETLVTHVRTLGLDLSGFMVLPPQGDDPALHFALLKKLAGRHGVSRLSMGMSGDYDLAACMGTDQIRVGTALFGGRPD